MNALRVRFPDRRNGSAQVATGSSHLFPPSHNVEQISVGRFESAPSALRATRTQEVSMPNGPFEGLIAEYERRALTVDSAGDSAQLRQIARKIKEMAARELASTPAD